MPLFFWKIFPICIFLSTAIFSLEVSLQEAEVIGKRIYANECSSKAEKLVWWNEGENFASLGIGHFIWYPQDQRGPFEETFPSLLAFLQANDIELPLWLKTAKGCPWNSKKEFLRKEQEGKKKELQHMLACSIALQVSFIVNRLEQTLANLLCEYSEDEKVRIAKQIERLQESLQGKYALVDYLNFKGAGISESERYQKEGWGLKQVLEKMPDCDSDPVAGFAAIAKEVLKNRVKNAPPERREERWLPGWLARVDSYTQMNSKVGNLATPKQLM